MGDDLANRRLTAIMATDVVGYSRLMALDETATLATLKAHRRDLIDNEIERRQGRIVKLTGDGMLVEFTSVVKAVACAADIQRGMRARNAHIPEERRIQLRIGVNVGDVIVEDDDIFGEGVNIAARLESIAETNGISVSGAVRDHIGDRLGLQFVDAGEQHLKNIDRPVRVFRVVTEAPSGSLDRRSSTQSGSNPEPLRPLIAVLPFNNISGDPEQEFFADGISEDIITDLSKVSGLSVIARTSTFMFKGRAVDLSELRRKFNVSNVLEGSVRRSGQRVRINAQLVSAKDGTHLWAERYDRDLKDIFLLQDEITHSIVDALKVRLLPVESAAIRKTTTSDSEAYEFYLRGRHYLSHHSLKAYDSAERMFLKAVEIDPNYARAYAGAADCGAFRSMNNADVSVAQILALCDKALVLDQNLAEAHASRGFALSLAARYDESMAEFERAVELDPSSFEAHYFCARSYVLQGRAAEAADYFRRVTEIAPDDFQAYGNLSHQYSALGRLDDALEAERLCLERAERELERHPDNVRAVCYGALSLTILGEVERAREWGERAIWLDPDDAQVLYNVASMFALLGDRERAIELLNSCLPRMHPQMVKWASHDLDFASLRDDQRFVELVGRADTVD